MAAGQPVRVEAFSSFHVKVTKKFDIHLASQIKQEELIVSITNPILGQIDKRLEWIENDAQPNGTCNKCRVSFRAPIVGLYSVSIEIANQPQYGSQFQAKAYDYTKVFICGSSGKCFVNETYEFSIDASEAGEGQLEIAVNEGEIPNQVQVLDNGKCIVSFVPEESGSHLVDIRFNGHNVQGCPFLVDVMSREGTQNGHEQTLPTGPATLTKKERLLIETTAIFSIENITSLGHFDKDDLMVVDPEGQSINYQLHEDPKSAQYRFEFLPKSVGDYRVELSESSTLYDRLPAELRDQFPFMIKVFDFRKVIVSDISDGVIGHPVFFYIDASQAGSGNLEIRVSTNSKNVPNIPQSESNAKIRVSFTPTEAIEHSIDVKFNGIPVPGSPFLVRVNHYPQARLPISSQDLLKYVPINEPINFYVEYIGSKENRNIPVEELTSDSCRVQIVRPDSECFLVDSVKLKLPDKNIKQARFEVTFMPTKIGPYKIFITVNNELLPASPILCNVYNIQEVKVQFDQRDSQSKPIGYLNKPVSFTVDASRAGEGTLALAVVSSLARNPVQTDVKVSEQGHGLYNLTFIPSEFAPHLIDMSFNEKLVPQSPFTIDILDDSGKSASSASRPKTPVQAESTINSRLKGSEKKPQQSIERESANHTDHMIQNFERLSLKSTASSGNGSTVQSASKTAGLSGNETKTPSTRRKSLAFGLVKASNVVYLETGVLENNKNHVSISGPAGDSIPFSIRRDSPAPGEPKRLCIEYKPDVIGTHTISVLDGKDLRQYMVEICDPSLIAVRRPDPDTSVVGRPILLQIDSSQSGEIQLDTITILGPKRSSSGKIRDGESTILGRIKSMSSSSSSNQKVPIEYTLSKSNDRIQELIFVPPVPGKYTVDIRCLGQPVGSRPLEILVKDDSSKGLNSTQEQRISGSESPAISYSTNQSNNNNLIKSSNKEDELLQSIIVHGISLKCAPVNSTGAFIIETNKLAQARDFDVLITDPNNSLVDVQCYLQQDGNLLAEWTPRRVGTHKIEVLYKDRQVPNSPFISEAFDPSAVIVENLKSTSCFVNEQVCIYLNRREAGFGELDVAITSPVGRDLPIEIKPMEDGIGETVSFTPTIAGKYKMSITLGGYDIPRSPLVITARDVASESPIKVSGLGLKGAEVNRSAQFTVEASSEGQLKLRIECGDREIVPKVEKIGDFCYSVKYKPTEVGYATISLYWNGAHIGASPYTVPINDLSKILFLSGTNKTSTSNNQRIVEYEPNVKREITLDTSKCGPGELKAEAYCRAEPSIKFIIPVTPIGSSKYQLTFVCPPRPEQLATGISLNEVSQDATYLVRLFYNSLFVPEQLASVVLSPISNGSNVSASRVGSLANKQSDSPPQAISSKTDLKTGSRHANGDLSKVTVSETGGPIVALRGHGLAEAKCGEIADFTIDGSEAGPGKPEVRFSGPSDEVKVRIDELGKKQYKASYVVPTPGSYILNVLWDGKQVAGCPITVSVSGQCDPKKVVCTGDGLKGGVLDEEIKTYIDTRRAGPGELIALCSGPTKVAFCELVDRGDGTFVLFIKPQESGRHLLTIKYEGENIPKSPFLIKISGRPDPTKVRVYGPGVEHGVLSLYQSRFVCDTRGAGAGQLTVRIRGPKGAFRMETQRESQRDRTILCKYDPTEPGDYRIEIKWSGKHVPGSPFSVMIFDTQEELNRFLMSGQTQPRPIRHMKQSNPMLNHHQAGYQSGMLDYGQYSATTPGTQGSGSGLGQAPFRL